MKASKPDFPSWNVGCLSESWTRGNVGDHVTIFPAQISLSLRLTMLLLAGAFGIFCFRDAHASGTCNTYLVIQDIADKAASDIKGQRRVDLAKYEFSMRDPLDEFEWLEASASKMARKARDTILKCAPEDSLYLALLQHQEWGERAMMLAVSESVRGDAIELSEVLVGYLIDNLNGHSIPSVPEKRCRPRGRRESVKYSSGMGEAWFRERQLFWVRCESGRVLSYLPESGWMPATPDQIEKIRATGLLEGADRLRRPR